MDQGKKSVIGVTAQEVTVVTVVLEKYVVMIVKEMVTSNAKNVEEKHLSLVRTVMGRGRNISAYNHSMAIILICFQIILYIRSCTTN